MNRIEGSFVYDEEAAWEWTDGRRGQKLPDETDTVIIMAYDTTMSSNNWFLIEDSPDL
jgi:hypothetical protein